MTTTATTGLLMLLAGVRSAGSVVVLKRPVLVGVGRHHQRRPPAAKIKGLLGRRTSECAKRKLYSNTSQMLYH